MKPLKNRSLRFSVPKWLALKPARKGMVIVLAILVATSAAAGGVAAAHRGVIYPKTRIGGIDFGGKTPSEARELFEGSARQMPQLVPLAIDSEVKAMVAVADVGLAYHPDSTVERLYQVGRSGNWLQRGYQLVRSLAVGNAVEAAFSLDQGRFKPVVDAVLDQANIEARDAGVVLSDDGTPVLSPAQSGHGVTREVLEESLWRGLATLAHRVEIASARLEPTILDHQAVGAVEQTKIILQRAPFTIVAGPTKHTVDSTKLYSWLSYQLAAPTTLLPFATPETTVSPTSTTQTLSDVLIPTLDPKRISEFLASLASSVNQEPVNAILGAKDGRVVVVKPHRNGQALDTDESVQTIIASLHAAPPIGDIALELKEIPAEIQESTIASLGIRELIGRAETRFTGSPENRVHNITTGANFLNGAIVGKDQEFSTIKTLGKIDGSTGYLPELVIKGDRTIPEFGGGLCQVSTTLFRAALSAGLPITARTNHSYRVGYYEPPVGLDATIFQNPDVDFKFKNDTPGHILIQSRVEGKKITFEFYGTNDGRQSHLTDPIVTNVIPPPPEIRIETDTLPKGEVKQIEKPHDGATAEVTYTVQRDGKEIYRKVFRSRYVPWTARFLVGTREG